MKDFKYERFNSIYDFEKVVNTRPVNEVFKNHEHSKNTSREDWYKTSNYDEAEDLLKKGWNTEVQYIEKELKKFSATVQVKRNKQIKSIAGYAPCVPNAILGVPKSMFATKVAKREEKKRTAHIIFNNTAGGGVSSKDLIKSGMTVLKLAVVLDKMNVRTKIDLIPKMSCCGNSIYGCSVSIKDYRQPFNVSKIAYPLAHVSFFRRHGFRWMETMEGCTNNDFNDGYGKSMIYIDKKLRDEYFEFAGFMKDEVIYIDFDDVRKADYDYETLAKNKGVAL